MGAGLPKRLVSYVGLVGLGGLAWLLYLLQRDGWDFSNGGDLAFFIALIAIAGSFPLPVAPRVTADISTAALFSAALCEHHTRRRSVRDDRHSRDDPPPSIRGRTVRTPEAHPRRRLYLGGRNRRRRLVRGRPNQRVKARRPTRAPLPAELAVRPIPPNVPQKPSPTAATAVFAAVWRASGQYSTGPHVRRFRWC